MPGVRITMSGFSPAPGGATDSNAVRSILAVLTHGLDCVILPKAGERLDHRRPVLDDVADPAGIAQVVLQHSVPAFGVAHEVNAGDHAMRIVRNTNAERIAFESRPTTSRAIRGRCRRP